MQQVFSFRFFLIFCGVCMLVLTGLHHFGLLTDLVKTNPKPFVVLGTTVLLWALGLVFGYLDRLIWQKDSQDPARVFE